MKSIYAKLRNMLLFIDNKMKYHSSSCPSSINQLSEMLLFQPHWVVGVNKIFILPVRSQWQLISMTNARRIHDDSLRLGFYKYLNLTLRIAFTRISSKELKFIGVLVRLLTILLLSILIPL